MTCVLKSRRLWSCAASALTCSRSARSDWPVAHFVVDCPRPVMLASCRTGGSLAWTWDLEKAVVVLGKDSGKRGMAGWLVAHGRLADHNTGASRSTSTTTVVVSAHSRADSQRKPHSDCSESCIRRLTRGAEQKISAGILFHFPLDFRRHQTAPPKLISGTKIDMWSKQRKLGRVCARVCSCWGFPSGSGCNGQARRSQSPRPEYFERPDSRSRQALRTLSAVDYTATVHSTRVAPAGLANNHRIAYKEMESSWPDTLACSPYYQSTLPQHHTFRR
ncbi:hypothetical protein HDK77DRAFT_253437 [Phyllosticta capitalensis]